MSAFNRSCLFMRDREPYSEWFLCCLVEERDKTVIATALNLTINFTPHFNKRQCFYIIINYLNTCKHVSYISFIALFLN